MSDDLNLGACCECGERDCHNVMMLDFKAPIPGTGWGCVVCKLPQDGAVAVLCNSCMETVNRENRTPRLVCVGYPYKNVRETAPVGEKRVHFDHVRQRHPELAGLN